MVMENGSCIAVSLDSLAFPKSVFDRKFDERGERLKRFLECEARIADGDLERRVDGAL